LSSLAAPVFEAEEALLEAVEEPEALDPEADAPVAEEALPVVVAEFEPAVPVVWVDAIVVALKKFELMHDCWQLA